MGLMWGWKAFWEGGRKGGTRREKGGERRNEGGGEGRRRGRKEEKMGGRGVGKLHYLRGRGAAG